MICQLLGHRVVEDHGRVYLLKGREGAGDERTGSHFAVHCEGDHVVVKGGDHWHQCPADTALARAILNQGNYGAKGTLALPPGPATLEVSLFPPFHRSHRSQQSASWRQLPVAILQTPTFQNPISDELVTTTRQRSLPRQKLISARPPTFALPPSHPGSMPDRQLRPRSSVNV
jgi:hypothetical protein